MDDGGSEMKRIKKGMKEDPKERDDIDGDCLVETFVVLKKEKLQFGEGKNHLLCTYLFQPLF